MIKFICVFLLVLAQYVIADSEDSKTKCQGCRDLVDGILKGLDKTKNKNFEGGDVDWEEKKLGTYKTSETRLIEILEGACSKSNHRCNSILEEREEDIENWYKKKQDEISLLRYLCIDKAEVCCEDGKFGPDCSECPKGDSDTVCFGRGECEGAGDREGSGKCICNEGYDGELCDKCGERYFESFHNDTYTLCSLCHQSCKTCKGNKSTDCVTCMGGFREEENIDNEEEIKCTDINECAEQQNLCAVGTYCANNEGSYSCEDIDECASGAICLGMYEVCINTLGHYKCECARYFRRDPVSGQCQPDPNIYSQLGPQPRAPPPPSASDKKVEGDEKTSGEKVVENVEESLDEDDIKRLAVAVLICIIGTAAASGNLIWTALFFLSIFAAGLWWASDKTEQIAHSLIPSHQEL